MKKKLVLIGGGHAHMTALENISKFVEKGYEVTVVGPSFYHYYSGMGPGMLGGTYTPSDIRFATRDVVCKQGGVFVKDYVSRIDPSAKTVQTAGGQSLAYDVLSVNAGSYVSMEDVAEGADNIYPVKPIEKLMEAAEKLKILFKRKKAVVTIVGGGPSSAEVAGNIWQLAKQAKQNMPEIKILAGSRFMARFPESVRSRVAHILGERGIRIFENGYVKKVTAEAVLMVSGESLSTDFTFLASGVKPSKIFETSGLPVGPDKGLLVNRYLQSVRYPDIFGGGDCISFKPPLDKVGVYAVRQNPVLLNNLFAQLAERPLQVFNPGPEYLLIFNLGANQGVLKKRGIVFSGKPAFWIKNYIDTKFMKKFQAIEKRRA